MANIKNGNTWYIDATTSSTSDDLVGNVQITGVILSATAANGRIVLSDSSNAAHTKLDLRVATSGASQQFFFDVAPVSFPNGVRVSTLSNAVATLIYKSTGSA